MLAVAALARRVHPRAGFWAAAAALLTPAFQLGGILTTVDMPYTACWALACLAASHALLGGSRRAWLGLAAGLGAGFLFKYTILFLVPGVVLFAILGRGRLRLAPGWPVWAALGVILFALLALPVVIWNSAHGWPTLRHLLGHAALPGGDMPAPAGNPPDPRPVAWLLQYLGAQVALIGPVIALIAVSVAAAWKRRRDDDGHRLLCVCIAVPILVLYGLLALRTRVEGNWAIAGYVSLFALAGWAVAARRSTPPPPLADAIRGTWRVCVVGGLIVAVAPLRLDWIDAFPPVRLLESAVARAGLIDPGARLVPMGRLTRAADIARDAARLADALRARTGLEPFYIAEHYGRAGLLAFYLPGRPVVYCSSSQRNEGRLTQYDYWRDTDLADLHTLGGRPAVMIGSKHERWAVAFEHVEHAGRLPSETKKNRETFLGLRYRGFGVARTGTE